MTPLLVAHDSLREDGRVGVMLINTQPLELSAATVTVTIEGGEVGARGERYDYFPVEAVPTVPDGGVPAMDGGTPDAAASFSPIMRAGSGRGAGRSA